MIKLQLPEKPKELTIEKEKELVDKFKADNTSVWKKTYIIKPLLEMTHNKCAYSEQEINQESTYMEIDHFKYKNKYKDDVVKWGNLLPSCKKCNDTKSDWDVIENPIVNPLTDIPKNFLYVKGFRFYKKNDIGSNTITALALNDRDHFVQPRAKIGFRIVDTLEECLDTLNNDNPKTVRRIKSIINRIKSILKECDSTHPYSAVLATYILYEVPVFGQIEETLNNLGLWDNELEKIKEELNEIALPPPN